MTTEAEDRRLTAIGAVVLACVAATVLVVAFGPFGGRPPGQISVSVQMPAVGQGITIGTPLLMHGVPVGTVTAVSNVPGGSVRLDADVRSAPTSDLTDTLAVDFRPANYFGVTGINLIPGSGGLPLRDGTQIHTASKGDFTLQALLTRLGEITDGVVTPQLISVVDRATRYTDGLDPLIETMVTAADTLARVQTVSTEQLLRNATGISVAFPGFVDAATAAGNDFSQGSGVVRSPVTSEHALPLPQLPAVLGERITEEYWRTRTIPTLELLSNSLFGALGNLLSTHTGDLLPAVELVTDLSDTVPALVAPAGIAATTVELRTRLERMYAGSPEQRALQVRIMLDNLPGVQAPVASMGGPQ